jgi:hypothetical protein
VWFSCHSDRWVLADVVEYNYAKVKVKVRLAAPRVHKGQSPLSGTLLVIRIVSLFVCDFLSLYAFHTNGT